ncbi:hypothetical protein BSKO_09063 [Bryopsis sp. KO-2023]|nr:hypothetical protein BSKO_09063 [Bryopsis sp. KO-2023]
MGKTEIQGKEAGPVGGGGGGCPPTSAASVGKDHRGGQRSIIEEKRQPDNVSDLFRARVGDFRNEILHGRAGDDCCWTGATFRDVSLAVVQISQNLQNYGCRAGSRIGVCGDNSPQWMELFYACSFFSGICVAVDRNCKGPDLASAIEHTNMEILVTCSSKVGDVISAINDNKEESDRAWQLHTIVVWGCDDPFKLRLYNQAVASRGISLIGWEEFLDSTHMITHPDTPPSASDPHVIFYSAGQKATVVHHGALVASIYSLHLLMRG